MGILPEARKFDSSTVACVHCWRVQSCDETVIQCFMVFINVLFKVCLWYELHALLFPWPLCIHFIHLSRSSCAILIRKHLLYLLNVMIKWLKKVADFVMVVVFLYCYTIINQDKYEPVMYTFSFFVSCNFVL